MSTATPPALALDESPPFPVRRFTVDEYRQLGEAGVLTEEDRIELLEGWIIPKMVHNPPHDSTVDQAGEQIAGRLPPGWRIRVQSAVTTDDSEPEPDLAVVRGRARDYRHRHPGPDDIGLLVEVADTTLLHDRFKCRIYARARIPVYWIINLPESKVEVYTEPSGPTAEPSYARCDEYGPDDLVPLAVAGQELDPIPVRDLLP